MMKNILKIFVLLAISANLISCKDDNTGSIKPVDPVLSYYQLAGTWKLVEWNGVAQDETKPYVYIKLDSKEQTFSMYSNIDSYYPTVRTGYFDLEYDDQLEYNVLTGYYDYSFGFFQYDYRVVKSGDDKMIWTAIDAEDKCVYVRSELPEGLE